MKSSKLELPFSDFEAGVLLRIQEEAKQKARYSKGIKLSTLFFLLGTGFGLIIQNMMRSTDQIYGIPAQQILLVFQVLYAVTVLTQLENILQLISKLKK